MFPIRRPGRSICVPPRSLVSHNPPLTTATSAPLHGKCCAPTFHPGAPCEGEVNDVLYVATAGTSAIIGIIPEIACIIGSFVERVPERC